MTTIQFFVQGSPVGKGSMKAFIPPGRKFPVVVHDSSKTKPWSSLISLAARQEADKAQWPFPRVSPISLGVEFVMPRPAYHYGTGKNADRLKENAPDAHTSKPDLDKLVRLVADALTGILWNDDNQIANLIAHKRYSNDGRTGVTITVGVIATNGEHP